MEKHTGFQLDSQTGYFKNNGVDVMAFMDIYPVGHQAGVSMIMHGKRIATNGDLRFEPTPGQWQAVPKQLDRTLDEKSNTITTKLCYPDKDQHLTGFNPLLYPDFEFTYEVRVHGEGGHIVVSVDLDHPVPEEFLGKLCFNLELVPHILFGKPWIMDKKQGIFPTQPNGPTLQTAGNHLHPYKEPDTTMRMPLEKLTHNRSAYNPATADTLIAEPYAVGRRFTSRPDDPCQRFTVESIGADLKLYDGRMNHNNGWFVLSSEVPAGKTKDAIHWIITPSVVEDWMYAPVVQVSQVGYHPAASKAAVIELDQRDSRRGDAILYQITENGPVEIQRGTPKEWGDFLRYHYLKYDFSAIQAEGLYEVVYGSSTSAIFRIASDIYDRGVWQPVLEYFLPIQMCHMRVSEKYRVWHDLCHDDDARMAPVNYNHFDGYVQGPSTLTKYQPGDRVPGLNVGGWHDAGDFDLRVESQAGEAYNLALAFEAFHVDYDATTIDQKHKITEIHQPDGKNDILQQIEHGVLSVVSGYRALGRLYRGIICNDLRQYVLLGDPSAMTKNIAGDEDDRCAVLLGGTGGRLQRLAAACAGNEQQGIFWGQCRSERPCLFWHRADHAALAQTAQLERSIHGNGQAAAVGFDLNDFCRPQNGKHLSQLDKVQGLNGGLNLLLTVVLKIAAGHWGAFCGPPFPAAPAHPAQAPVGICDNLRSRACGTAG